MLKSKFTALFTVFLVLGLLSGCGDDVVELTIFHTNDIHSHLHPPKSDEFGLGGMARLATLLKERRSKRLLQLTLDAGDWSEGSWFYNTDTGANMLRLLGAMDFDATVVGNHDYLNGPDRLWRTVVESGVKFPVLAANLDLSQVAGAEEFRKHVGSTTILERQGLKIGLIGITQVDYPYSFYLAPARATDPVEEAQRQAKILRPLVDVLIILSHNGFATNVQLARATLGVDAVISGHSHVKRAKALLVENAGRKVPVVETGEWGRFLGELQLKVSKKKKLVEFGAYLLHPVLPTLASDPELSALVAAEDARLTEHYGSDVHEEVAETEVALDNGDTHTVGLAHLVTKAYRDATAAQVALELGSLAGVKVPSGKLSVMDLHDMMPHIFDFRTGKEWTIKLWQARGNDLALMVNLFTLTNLIEVDGKSFFAFDNLEIAWEPKHEGNTVPRITATTIGGVPLDPTAHYSVALTDGMLLALNVVNTKLHLGLDLTSVQETGIEGWRAVVNYGVARKTFTARGLAEGARTFTTIADPAVFPQDISFDGAALVVNVRNEGLTRLAGVKLRCLAGKVDDIVAFDTDEQVFAPIGEVEVPPVEPLSVATVRVAWQPVPGFWPVHCAAVSTIDGYEKNSASVRVLQVVAPRH